MTLYTTERPADRVLSVHPFLVADRWGDYARASRIEEFCGLVEAADCELIESIELPVRRPLPGTLLGAGQVEDVAASVRACDAQVVFVDHRLTPVQQRNLERAWKAKVVDRTGLILEIFAARARTREGVLQVELASLNYQISRLVRSWTHLERQRGGHGFMGGPGERQIELDRRMIRTRIKAVERELAQARRRRGTQRAGRKHKAIPTVALVGYTNAGKSTLFNRLTEAEVYAADQLFATLDPTLRLLELEGSGRIVLSDTVGFVQDLPHELVDAFRATLEEVVEADLILIVRDAADPLVRERGEVVRDTLARLGLEGEAAPPIVEVWNKIDLGVEVQERLTEEVDASRVPLSARTGEGIETLLALLRRWLARGMSELTLTVDAGDGRTIAFCHASGEVLEQRTRDALVELDVRLHPRDAGRLECVDGVWRLRE